ncbi:hypothetical protein [Mesorhizobium sp. dw_380]|uniref:hypothetical protein n=1 Tax=Mesorhizobium sp. dw_380 TaxID=2812001 RepID=UPI001BDEBCCF|nr:hypothetical protein [Mesorhizobium sp. dw_380]
MSTAQQEPAAAISLHTVSPAQRYSKMVEFADEVAEQVAKDAPTLVEIFSDGRHWYCRIRRGDEKTRPMGPYTKLQAERIARPYPQSLLVNTHTLRERRRVRHFGALCSGSARDHSRQRTVLLRSALR